MEGNKKSFEEIEDRRERLGLDTIQYNWGGEEMREQGSQEINCGPILGKK